MLTWIVTVTVELCARAVPGWTKAKLNNKTEMAKIVVNKIRLLIAYSPCEKTF